MANGTSNIPVTVQGSFGEYPKVYLMIGDQGYPPSNL